MPKKKSSKNFSGIVPQIPMKNIMRGNKATVMPMGKHTSKGRGKKKHSSKNC